MAFLLTDFLGTLVWFWIAFGAIVIALMVFDLGVLHRKTHEIGVTESLLLTAFYIAMAVAFGTWVWWQNGAEDGMNYFTGFLIEKSLSLDNVFVFSLIFTYFAVPRLYHHRVLFWGILGVIVLRAIMIGLGSTLVAEFAWILYVFGAFLILTGIKMLVIADSESKIENNPVIRYLRKRMRVTDEIHGERFFVTKPDPTTGAMVRHATPLVLVLVNVADVIFAVDSVPAIFAITTDTFIVYTSNIFAILGLRALYFVLLAMIHRFVYLKYALSIVLIFIGGKIFYNQIYGKLDPVISLSVTFALILGGIVFSLFKTRNADAARAHG
ncbi:MAG: TerC family protein [Alphaproteobacteria bacterium]|nr:TerC family protein [Alphaproteobacteria bacterium]